MTYRADIDGLRAIAVLAVVMFHLEIVLFAGGYIGVDVFFVISGYLITSIIKVKYDDGVFSFADFYFRRIRRLIPPLIATVAVTVIAAGFLLTPYDMMTFGRSAVAALFSLSNFVFYAEAGYWDSASELKPLLHTWSLGVEEQFYLFWPALTVAMLAMAGRVSLLLSLSILVSAGAAACVWYSYIDLSAAFYLFPFRIFQFAAGALVLPLSTLIASSERGVNRTLLCGLGSLGLLLIGLSVFLLGEHTPFPGWYVLVPTLGSVLVLLAGATVRSDWRLGQLLLESRVSQWVGRASYSMYLVHWPIISLYRYATGVELSALEQVSLGLATLGTTCVLHYSVERRFYQRSVSVDSGLGKKATASGRFALKALVVSSIVAVFPLTAWIGDGWSARYPTLSLSPEEIELGKEDRYAAYRKACFVHSDPDHPACRSQAEVKVLIIGNSHVPDVFNFLNGAFAGDENIGLIVFGDVNLCKNLNRMGDRFVSTSSACQDWLDALFDGGAASSIDVIVYGANRPYRSNKQSLLALVKAVKAKYPRAKLLTYGGYINTVVPCARLVNETQTTDSCAMPENVEYFADQPEQQPLFDDFALIEDGYIDRVGMLCKNRVLQTCLTRAEDGSPMFYDRHHLSRPFAEMTGRMYLNKHPDFLYDLVQ
ncbi:MAG: acyltransferase family protein [Halioglobus sp.]